MKIILAIGFGSFIGGVSRYLLSKVVNLKFTGLIPWGTFAVNIIGCFLIGLAFAIFTKNYISKEWHLFFVTGVLGGFTTFSAFSYEILHLLKTGNSLYALAYIFLSILIGVGFTYLGYVVVK